MWSGSSGGRATERQSDRSQRSEVGEERIQVAEVKAYIVDWEQNGFVVGYDIDRNPEEAVQVARKLSELIMQEFPEEIVWSTQYPRWMDFEAMGVLSTYSARLEGWIESNTEVLWWGGEPVILEWKDLKSDFWESVLGKK